MAVDPNKKKVQMVYNSDNGGSYAVLTTQAHATAAGASGTSSDPPYPRHWRPRCVHGIAADGIQKAKLVIPAAADDLFLSGSGSFTIAGVGDFTVTGATGERRSRQAPASA